ncbi:hypothetical protein RF074_23765, partial [Serratia marcescens]|uniref:hypothetical protein n=1 Tax=Serratia marcescens TaxID=615 RepID=UPI002814617B
HNDRTIKCEEDDADEGLSLLFGPEKKQVDQISEAKRRLQKLFTSASTPELLIFSNDDEDDEANAEDH